MQYLLQKFNDFETSTILQKILHICTTNPEYDWTIYDNLTVTRHSCDDIHLFLNDSSEILLIV